MTGGMSCVCDSLPVVPLPCCGLKMGRESCPPVRPPRPKRSALRGPQEDSRGGRAGRRSDLREGSRGEAGVGLTPVLAPLRPLVYGSLCPTFFCGRGRTFFPMHHDPGREERSLRPLERLK